jgi:hypothetical protein
VPSVYKSGETKWPDLIEEILAENKEVATDFAGLEETLAGHQTLRERLDDLTPKIRLCQAEEDRMAARHALETFCESGDDTALRVVEWLFLQNPADRRSASQGLKGLLIARKLRAPREGPMDRVARETASLLERLAGADDRDASAIRQYVDERKTRAGNDRREAIAMAELLDAVASGAVPSSSVPATLAPIIDRITGSPDRVPQDCERLARAWEQFGRPGADAPVAEGSVLLGLVQLSLARLREQAVIDDRYRMVAAGEDAGELRLSAAVEGERTSLGVAATNWSAETRTKIHRWLLEKVRPLYFDENGTALDEDEEEEGIAAITLDVEWTRGRSTTPLGVIEVLLPNRVIDLIARSRHKALMSVKYEGETALWRVVGELYETDEAEFSAEDPRDDAVRSAWADYVRALGEDLAWAAIACVSPLPAGAEDQRRTGANRAGSRAR